MEKLKKIFGGILILMLLTITLTACTKDKTKTEKEILEDIKTNDDYFSTYNLNVDSFEVTKRQTNQESKSDYVWCDVTASNDDFTYNAQYEVTYGLYNDGWLLDSCYNDYFDYSANWYPSEEDAKEYFDEINSDLIFDDFVFNGESDKGNTYITYSGTISGEREGKYLISDYDLTLSYTFYPNQGWVENLSEIPTYRTYDILGEWAGENRGDIFNINFIDTTYNADNDVIYVNFEYNRYSEATKRNYYSDDIETRKIINSSYSDCDFIVIYNGLNIEFYDSSKGADRDGIYCFGPYYTDGYELIKQ